MREIKFRAWDGEQMIILSNAGIQYFDFEFGEVLSFSVDGYKEFWGHECYPNRKCDYPIMQYTGIRDKNGVQVYEGDIVRILYTDWGSKSESDNRTLEQYLIDIAEIKVVIWSQHGFYVSHTTDGYAESMFPGTHGYMEIIGNIYQNPELLNLNPHVNRKS